MWAAIQAALGIADSIADSLFETEEEKAAATQKVLGALQQVDLAQLNINLADAQSRHWWQYGWRPAIGWTCAFAVFFQFVLAPLFTWVNNWVGWGVPPLPSFDQFLWELMFGMLGIAGLRSWDKMKGTTK
jgi:hypothetical protein|tara:strand:- start:349 stop:738 length:390 start_codon:yes stop_codon:yes gene_type:complete